MHNFPYRLKATRLFILQRLQPVDALSQFLNIHRHVLRGEGKHSDHVRRQPTVSLQIGTEGHVRPIAATKRRLALVADEHIGNSLFLNIGDQLMCQFEVSHDEHIRCKVEEILLTGYQW